jgi:hypothetical protein
VYDHRDGAVRRQAIGGGGAYEAQCLAIRSLPEGTGPPMAHERINDGLSRMVKKLMRPRGSNISEARQAVLDAELVGDRLAARLTIYDFLTLLVRYGGYNQLKQVGVSSVLGGVVLAQGNPGGSAS